MDSRACREHGKWPKELPEAPASFIDSNSVQEDTTCRRTKFRNHVQLPSERTRPSHACEQKSNFPPPVPKRLFGSRRSVRLFAKNPPEHFRSLQNGLAFDALLPGDSHLQPSAFPSPLSRTPAQRFLKGRMHENRGFFGTGRRTGNSRALAQELQPSPAALGAERSYAGSIRSLSGYDGTAIRQ